MTASYNSDSQVCFRVLGILQISQNHLKTKGAKDEAWRVSLLRSQAHALPICRRTSRLSGFENSLLAKLSIGSYHYLASLWLLKMARIMLLR